MRATARSPGLLLSADCSSSFFIHSDKLDGVI
jgi:hypothetical protein